MGASAGLTLLYTGGATQQTWDNAYARSRAAGSSEALR